MKYLAVIVLIISNVSAAHAQVATQLTPAQQQQLQASIDATVTQNYSPPQPQVPLNQQVPAPANEPKPWEYGQSVMTDIRQMNF